MLSTADEDDRQFLGHVLKREKKEAAGITENECDRDRSWREILDGLTVA